MTNPKTRVRVSSTSYLLPGARAWRALSAEYALDFGEYGDWSDALLGEAPSSILALIVFFDDLISEEAAETMDADAVFESVARPLLDLLKERLGAASAPTLVGWVEPRPASLVASGRRQGGGRTLSLRFEAELYAVADNFPGLYVLPLHQALNTIGGLRAFDARNYYAAHCRLSADGVTAVAGVLAMFLERLRRPACKVLVLDCDNTLWGGVVGEDGVSGLRLGEDGEGAAFADFQKVIRRLAGQGLVLALASKNNEAEAWAVFDEHAGMILRREHISAWRIDWHEKADNIASIAGELGVGLDSVAFWDDNPLEREKVKGALPQVRVLEVPDAVVEWPLLIASAPEFARFETTEEDRRKTEQYRARGAFVREVSNRTDRQAFLRSIELRPEALPVTGTHLARAAQLCAKTNQFNVRSERHSSSDLSAAAAAPGVHALVRLVDRFGDHGVVGLMMAMVNAEDEEVAFLDTFLMSCRVLGRELEAWMLHHLVSQLKAAGVTHLVAEYRPTAKNGMVAALFPERGFQSWSAIDAALAARLAGAAAPWSPTGDLYVADCRSIIIPGLEIYDRVTHAA